eukprot:m.89075 g.89075  ORF g.89075 m.89075 type:complete len:888 (+) comp13205_c0_seq4:160-2823(+)
MTQSFFTRELLCFIITLSICRNVHANPAWARLTIEPPASLTWNAKAEYIVTVDDTSGKVFETHLPCYNESGGAVVYEDILLGLYNDSANITIDYAEDPSDPFGMTIKNSGNVVQKGIQEAHSSLFLCTEVFGQCDAVVLFTVHLNRENVDGVSLKTCADVSGGVMKVSSPVNFFLSHLAVHLVVYSGSVNDINQAVSISISSSSQINMSATAKSFTTIDSYETESMLELSETLKLQAATDVELSVTMEGPLSLSNDSCSSTQTLVTLYGFSASTCEERCSYDSLETACLKGCAVAHPDYFSKAYCAYLACPSGCASIAETEGVNLGCTYAESFPPADSTKQCMNILLETKLMDSDSKQNIAPSQLLKHNSTGAGLAGDFSPFRTTYSFSCPTATLEANRCTNYVCSRGEWIGLGSQEACIDPSCPDVCATADLETLLQTQAFHIALRIINSPEYVGYGENATVSCDESILQGKAKYSGSATFTCAKGLGKLEWQQVGGGKACSVVQTTVTTVTRISLTDTSQTKTATVTSTTTSNTVSTTTPVESLDLSAAELRAMNFTIFDMRRYNFTAQELHNAGYSLGELRIAGYDISDVSRRTTTVALTNKATDKISTTKKGTDESSSNESGAERIGLILIIVVIVLVIPAIGYFAYKIHLRKAEKRWERESQLAIPMSSVSPTGPRASMTQPSSPPASYADSRRARVLQGATPGEDVQTEKIIGGFSSIKESKVDASVRKKAIGGVQPDSSATDSSIRKTVFMGSRRSRGDTSTDDGVSEDGEVPRTNKGITRKKFNIMMGSRKTRGDSTTDTDPSPKVGNRSVGQPIATIAEDDTVEEKTVSKSPPSSGLRRLDLDPNASPDFQLTDDGASVRMQSTRRENPMFKFMPSNA